MRQGANQDARVSWRRERLGFDDTWQQLKHKRRQPYIQMFGRKEDMNPSPIIYLDSTFIIEAYESSTKSIVPIKVVKTEDISAGMSAIFLKAGASTKEAKEFPFSSRRMFEKMKKQLAAFPTVSLELTGPGSLPDYFWTEGVLWVSAIDAKTNNTVTFQDACFRLDPYAQGKGTPSLILVTNDVYFATGYDQILQHARGASQEFAIKVRALIKMLSLQDKLFGPLCTPLVIEKIANAQPN